jgi:hypothetical protein
MLGPPRIRFLQLVRDLPPDTWITRASLWSLMAFARPLLFAGSPQPATSDPIWPSASTVVIAEGTTPDGEAAVMVPSAVQALLSDSPDRGSHLPPWEEQWVVQADRAVVAPPNASPRALLDLWQIAELESNQGAAVFRVTPASVAAALNRGLQPGQVLELLERRSRTPLPDTVQRLVRDQGKRYGQIKVGSAQTYVRTDDPTLLEELLHHRLLADLRWHTLAPGVAVLQGIAPTDALQRLRKAGYLPVSDRPARQARKSAGSMAEDRTSMAPDPTVYPLMSYEQVRKQCRKAITLGASVTVTWFDGNRTRTEGLEPLSLHGRELLAARLRDGRELLLKLDNVVAVEILDDGEEWA